VVRPELRAQACGTVEGLQIDLAVRLSAEADPAHPKPVVDGEPPAQEQPQDGTHAAAELFLALKNEALSLSASHAT
jgi:hypothetical protein